MGVGQIELLSINSKEKAPVRNHQMVIIKSNDDDDDDGVTWEKGKSWLLPLLCVNDIAIFCLLLLLLFPFSQFHRP